MGGLGWLARSSCWDAEGSPGPAELSPRKAACSWRRPEHRCGAAGGRVPPPRCGGGGPLCAHPCCTLASQV